ncbi:MAG: prepilin-type N-terminal cleavage/methylation domain-containing protein [Planctomycetes bacterium]|nr:prepilin-type N-terminal cleavage/methylation domain-containing protein [Planctomycetota bacterium]
MPRRQHADDGNRQQRHPHRRHHGHAHHGHATHDHPSPSCASNDHPGQGCASQGSQAVSFSRSIHRGRAGLAAGFTLLEVMVSIVILAMVLQASASASIVMARSSDYGNAEVEQQARARAAPSRRRAAHQLERLRRARHALHVRDRHRRAGVTQFPSGRRLRHQRRRDRAPLVHADRPHSRGQPVDPDPGRRLPRRRERCRVA